MPKRPIAPTLKTLTKEALTLLREVDSLGKGLEKLLDDALEKAWRLGQKLLGIKAMVGHGNWLVWVEGNLSIAPRTAQRYMELAAANPDAERFEDLSAESVRKFRLQYVPEKERPELDGDKPLPRVVHHLTLLNDWRRLQRRAEIGQAKIDPSEARRDLKPLFTWLCGLYGVTPATVEA